MALQDIEIIEEELNEVDVMEDIEKEPSPSDKDNVIYTSFFNTEDFMLEQITEHTERTELSGDGKVYPSFAKYNKKTGEVTFVKQFSYKDKKIVPINDDIFQKGGIRLSTGVQEYKNTKEITDQIRDFLIKNCQLPKMYEGLLPNLVLFYWLYDKFPFIPYVGFIGGTGTGKTTAMMDFGSLCYKPIDTTGSLTIASLFRTATMWRGTLLIDEFYSVGEHSKEIIAFLKAGVSDRLVLRIEGTNKKEINAYIVKSPKLFTSENAVDDAGLNSRTMLVKMQKNTRPVPLYRLDHYYSEANEIRNKLLLWRFRNYDKINLKEIEYGFDELKHLDGRVQQILTPIYYFSDDETKKGIIEFAKEQEEETKRDRRESQSGAIFEIMINMWIRGKDPELVEIAKIVNEQRENDGYKTKITERKLGSIIRTELGFETKRAGQQGNTIVVRDTELENNKIEYFGIKTNEIVGVSSEDMDRYEDLFSNMDTEHTEHTEGSGDGNK